MQAGLGPMLRPPDILEALTSTEDAGPSGAVTTSAKPSQASSHRPDAGGMGKKITVAAACAVAGLIFYAARTRAPAVDSLGERTPPATEQEPAGPTAENPPPIPIPRPTLLPPRQPRSLCPAPRHRQTPRQRTLWSHPKRRDRRAKSRTHARTPRLRSRSRRQRSPPPRRNSRQLPIGATSPRRHARSRAKRPTRRRQARNRPRAHPQPKHLLVRSLLQVPRPIREPSSIATLPSLRFAQRLRAPLRARPTTPRSAWRAWRSPSLRAAA